MWASPDFVHTCRSVPQYNILLLMHRTCKIHQPSWDNIIVCYLNYYYLDDTRVKWNGANGSAWWHYNVFGLLGEPFPSVFLPFIFYCYVWANKSISSVAFSQVTNRQFPCIFGGTRSRIVLVKPRDLIDQCCKSPCTKSVSSAKQIKL